MSGNLLVLVTGAAGYVGKAVLHSLLTRTEYSVIACDRNENTVEILQTFRDANKFPNFGILQLDYVESLERCKPDIIIHLAASTVVSESVLCPEIYYDNNVSKLIKFAKMASDLKVKGFIFSSSSSVYGDNATESTTESTRMSPTSPYANTKMMGELLLSDLAMAHHMPTVALRYFNVAGADQLGRYGYDKGDATHLLPSIVRSVIKGEKFKIFGTDYPTADGTAIRSYTHITDIAEAHVKAIKYLSEKQVTYEAFNIGLDRAYSVKSMISHVNKALNCMVDFKECPRRAGDSTMQSASNQKASDVLGWFPMFSIHDIINHEYMYQKKSLDK